MSETLAAAPKRRRAPGSGGTAFYKTRGRSYTPMKEYRNRRRDPEARVAVKLAGELARLAAEFPRFRLSLNRLQHHVLLQVRTPLWKARAVLKALDHEAANSIREISKTTGLDFVSVTATLAQLHADDRVVPCSRAGRPLLLELERKTYWLRK